MKTLRIPLVAVASLALALPLFAKTTAWTGGASGAFSNAANYSNGAPVPGDEVVFPDSAVTLTDETFNLGAAGITLRNSKTVTSSVKFIGSGRLVKLGAGEYSAKVASSSTGGVLIGDGSISTGAAVDIFGGTGAIEINQQPGAAVVPFLNNKTYGGKITNPIRVVTGRTDLNTNGAIELGNPTGEIVGPIEGVCDFLIRQNYSTARLSSISAPGYTVTIANRASSGHTIVTGAIDANVVITKRPADDIDAKGAIVEFTGVSTEPDSSLTILAGTNLLASTSRWAGRTITIRGGDKARLHLTRSENLTGLPELTIEKGGLLELDGSVLAKVSALVVDGKSLEPGVYDAALLPDAILGAGSVAVGSSTGRYWIGGAKGLWNDPSNWDPAEVPPAGSTVIFTNKVIVGKNTNDSVTSETVDFGSGGMTLVTLGFDIDSYVSFTGSGKLVLRGKGNYDFCVASTYSGGTELRHQGSLMTDGVLTGHFGSGPIDLYRVTEGYPTLWSYKWDSDIPNAVNIHGSITDRERGAIFVSNKGKITGSISGDSDFLIRANYGRVDLEGPISTAGTVYFLNQNTGSQTDGRIEVKGDVSGNVSTIGMTRTANNVTYDCLLPIRFFGKVTAAEDSNLSFTYGTNTLETASTAAAKTVTVSGTKTVLQLSAAGNLNPDADLIVTDGAKVKVLAGVKASVGTLTVDGVKWPYGKYTKANAPFCTGDGILSVGVPGLILIFK